MGLNLWTAVALYYGAVNVLCAVLFAVDKYRAQHGQRRISEKALLGLSLAGGALGGLVAMRAVRHKTRKPAFYIGLPVMVAVHVALLCALAFAGGRLLGVPGADSAGAGLAGEKGPAAASAEADAEGAGDADAAAGLPPLDGGYAYVRARVLERDLGRRVAVVEVEPWEWDAAGVNVSGLSAGTTGEVDCSELLTMTGLKEGAAWIFSYKDTVQTAFPVTVASVESPESFAERAAQ